MYLVTGAAGFFGVHAGKLLLDEGYDVVSLGTSRLPQGVDWYAENTSEQGVGKVCSPITGFVSDQGIVEERI